MDFDSVMRSVAMVLGIGLVIFVHELGHFIAARLCKVRVETFSLGFGPKLFGWRRGDTLYQLAVLPIGGFCRMAGEDPGADAGQPPKHDELRAKGVGQRFFIYSGGVLMNMVFGIVVLPIVLFYGVPFDEPLVGSVVPGGGAWAAGIVPGTRIHEVNGAPVVGFEYIAHEVALGDPERALLVVSDPGSSVRRTVEVVPKYDKEIGISMIGVAPALDLSKGLQVEPDSPAARAGLLDGDVLLDVTSPLPELDLVERLGRAVERGEVLQLRVRGADGRERDVEVAPELSPRPKRRMLGVGQAHDVISALRPNEDLVALDLRVGDRIVGINGLRVLRQRDLELALLSSSEPVQIVVERAGRRREWTGPALDRARALHLASDVALNVEPGRLRIYLAARAAVAGVLRDGDVLLAANDVELRDWKGDFLAVTEVAARERSSIRLQVLREQLDGTRQQLDLEVTPAAIVVSEYGFAAPEAVYVYRARSMSEAVQVGVHGTWKFATDAWTMVKRMLLGQVSSKNMGGIISIGVVSYTLAGMGLAKLVFFLCMLSVNLAFINVLPIPLLDGGHLFFLAIEKLKGSPVSERVFGYSQVVGLVLILTLIIYVTYNDVVRWFF